MVLAFIYTYKVLCVTLCLIFMELFNSIKGSRDTPLMFFVQISNGHVTSMHLKTVHLFVQISDELHFLIRL